MTISFNLEKKDLEAYYWYEFTKSNRKKAFLYIAIIYLILGINIYRALGLNILLMYIGAIGIATPFLFKRAYKSIISKTIKEKEDINTNIDFLENKFIVQNAIAKTEILYTNIKKILEVKLYYYIFISNECIIIPKRAITDVDAFNKTIIQPLKK